MKREFILFLFLLLVSGCTKRMDVVTATPVSFAINANSFVGDLEISNEAQKHCQEYEKDARRLDTEWCRSALTSKKVSACRTIKFECVSSDNY